MKNVKKAVIFLVTLALGVMCGSLLPDSPRRAFTDANRVNQGRELVGQPRLRCEPSEDITLSNYSTTDLERLIALNRKAFQVEEKRKQIQDRKQLEAIQLQEQLSELYLELFELRRQAAELRRLLFEQNRTVKLVYRESCY